MGSCCEHGNELSASIKRYELLDWLENCQLFKKRYAPWISYVKSGLPSSDVTSTITYSEEQGTNSGCQVTRATKFCMVVQCLWTLKHSPVPVYLNFRVTKWGKTMDREGTGYETSICVTARDISENCQSHKLRPLEYHEPTQSL